MDIEQLSKSQIVLLTLLVSFVTSIATGIVTVSLMEQAPPAIAQTVNRVIERTVEKVVPSGQAASSVITKETTVVVKESDLIAQAIEKMRPSIVQINRALGDQAFLGLGVVYDAGGKIVTDEIMLGSNTDITITFADGGSARAFLLTRNTNHGTALLQSATTTVDGKEIRFHPANLATDPPSLGQTVVTLSGKSIARLADGLVTALIPRSTGQTPIIDTNISSDFIMGGSPLMNTDGALLGVSTEVARTSSQSGFMSSSVLVQQSQAETSTQSTE